MMIIHTSDHQFWGNTDSQTIQNAVDYASSTGRNRVVIPRFNARTGENIWNIDQAILLPSNMTVVVEDAHLRLCDGVFDNIFRTKNCMTPEGNTLEGEQENIHIIGSGNALLDGGVHNGLVEQLHRDNPVKYPLLSVNLLIFLHNTRYFSVSGLRFVNARWWAVCCIYCRWGRLSELDFRFYGTCENQDGIDLRVGCEYITIENITGITGDDTVALTAMPQDHLVPETALHVAGKNWHIHDVTIQNIIATTHGCNCVRLLCEDGAQIYNVTIDGVKNTDEAISGAALVLGTAQEEFADRGRKMGDMRNIVIRNVTTCAQRALVFGEAIQNVLLENITTYGQNIQGIRFLRNVQCKNVVIRNLTVNSDPETFDSALNVVDSKGTDSFVEGIVIENVYLSGGKHVFRGPELPAKNVQYENLSGSYQTDEEVKLPSAYGRYHRCYNGKVIEDRPEDNRFKDEKK